MARPIVALLFVAAALFAGCGGTDIAYTEVESPPAELPLPDGEIAVTDDAATTDDDSNVKTGRSTATAEPVAPSTDTTTTPVDPTTTTPVEPAEPVTDEAVTPPDDSGGAAPPTDEPVTEEPVEPTDDTGGAVAGGASDQFCADNPGAC